MLQQGVANFESGTRVFIVLLTLAGPLKLRLGAVSPLKSCTCLRLILPHLCRSH